MREMKSLTLNGITYGSFVDQTAREGGDVAALETLLRNILSAIQQGGTTSSTISEIEQLIVSYLENTSVEEVEA